LQEQDIAEHKPKVVVLVGYVPTNWMLPGTGQGIGKWRGRLVPIKVLDHVCWAYPILHPAGVMRKGGGVFKSEEEKIFERDLKTLFKKLRSMPTPDYRSEDLTADINWIRKGDDKDLAILTDRLQTMSHAQLCSVDIETKRLRPYKKDSAILSCSVTTRNHGTFVFPVCWEGFWKTPTLETKALKMLQWFLENSGRKVCHNTKFEQEWFAHKYGMELILGTKWGDTMAQAYVWDSRKGMLNLDVLIRMHFGFNLKALSPNIDVKRIWECDLPSVMLYNGLDTKWTLELYYVLHRLIKQEGLQSVVRERIRTGATIVGAQLVGVPVNERVRQRLSKRLTRAIEEQVDKARETRPWRRFVKLYGRDPNPDSHPDMKKLFGKIMKVKECKTAAGGITTADEVLSKLDAKKYPVAPIILEHRSLTTIKGTFVDPVGKLVDEDGRLHTSYGHLYTVSGRLNSEDPNLQNWVKHGEWKRIRAMIMDRLLSVVSFDYGQIEARVIAMASKDAVFIQMLWDEYDVHGEWAQRIWDEYHACLKVIGIKGKGSDPAVMKKYRQEVKNKWVFPLFFGATSWSVAKNLNLPHDVADFLYDEFWEIFAGIKEWQQELISRYNKVGYVETLTGRRRNAPCSYNEQINHPIQGTASDIVVAASSRLQDKGIQFNLNVHDDLTFLMELDKRKVKQIAKEMCRPVHSFVNVPLVIEVEAGPNWYKQKPIGVYASDKDFNFH